MSESEKPREGWVGLMNTRKDHYIVGFRSLCGRWGYLGSTAMLYPDHGPGPDDCVSCRRSLEKREREQHG